VKDTIISYHIKDYSSIRPISLMPIKGCATTRPYPVKYPAAELRGLQFPKKLSSPLSKIPLNYGGDGGGLRLRRELSRTLGVVIRSFPPHPNPLPPETVSQLAVHPSTCSGRTAK